MITLRETLNYIIRTSVATVNDMLTDDELVEAIAKRIVTDKLSNISIMQDDLIVGYTSTKSKDIENSEKDLMGIWIYVEDDSTCWKMNKCKSIGDAIKLACDYLGEVFIINDGKIINWDTFEDRRAFYFEDETIKVVDLLEGAYER